MCGRFNITSDPLSMLLMELVNLPYLGEDNANVAPTERVPVLRLADGAPELVPMRWWLTPHWSKEVSTRYAMFNARVETLSKSRAYREPYRKRRCVVPVSGFYEWVRERGEKLPFYIAPAEHSGLLLAGIWDRWNGAGESLESFTILTTQAHEQLRFVHHRQPVMLSLQDARIWLDPDSSEAALTSLFASTLPMALDVMPVAKEVNNARNKDPRCATPIGAATRVSQ